MPQSEFSQPDALFCFSKERFKENVFWAIGETTAGINLRKQAQKHGYLLVLVVS